MTEKFPQVRRRPNRRYQGKTYGDPPMPHPVEPAPEDAADEIVEDSANWEHGVVRPSESEPFDRERQDAFLRHVAKTGLEREAAASLGVAFLLIDEIKGSDPDFDAALADAHGLYAERIQKAVSSRGLYGKLAPVWHAGHLVGHEREYDHRLLAMEAKRTSLGYAAPAVSVNVNNVQNSGVLAVEPIALSEEEWEERFREM